ncbi:PIG-L family deacetylase [Streptomyces lunaelactis]|uniref:PIG-L deacetylase family protein n=1 Tax=Streptomyces lunaelactis TaxID=1535768 RepID=UPI001585CCB2|nr:PIG-L family deacetylase [Streptomyces lunaelactis]NUK09680.1 PIG-L family deacetylase [Streptomyces lunaelactis]NUL11946.1 PIG-L family deacetylase [Streptomyces lunaelactis]NUL25579.1 PIG-L family deacetylase [Streptomyces lunaelactis]
MSADQLTAAIRDGVPLLVLSPHLDDAVLSCGALLTHARSRVSMTVATVFTEAGPRPYTLSARRSLRLAGVKDAEELYASRRAEDREVLEGMGIVWRHLGLPEGLFRRKPGRMPDGSRRAHSVLPEAAYVYPTYRLHIASGRISRFDGAALAHIAAALDDLVPPEPRLLLAPLAVGGHVDHLLVRTAAELSNRGFGYYSDFPYNQRHSLDAGFSRRNALVTETWHSDIADKAALIHGYRTQAPLLFPDGRIPLVPEVYLLPGRPALVARADVRPPRGGPPWP